MSRHFSIGMLAKRVDCSVDSIRYYERKGLLPLAMRSPAGHRIYDESTVTQLRLIRRIRNLGFSLVETRSLVHAMGETACGEAALRIHAQLELVQKKMEELRKVETTLRSLEAACKVCGGCHCAMSKLSD